GGGAGSILPDLVQRRRTRTDGAGDRLCVRPAGWTAGSAAHIVPPRGADCRVGGLLPRQFRAGRSRRRVVDGPVAWPGVDGELSLELARSSRRLCAGRWRLVPDRPLAAVADSLLD